MRARGLGVRYRRDRALRDCSFEVAPGGVTALVGANGAGKSTLLKVAAGLLRPTEGTLEVGGEVGFVAQEKPLYREFTVADMLEFGKRANPRWDDRYAQELVDRVNLPRSRKTGRLSGGQRAYVALVLALARRPDVLLLDEPLAEMDPVTREDAVRSIMVTVAETGAAVLLSSHVVADLAGVCDRLLVLDRGEVRLDDPVDELVDGHRLVVAPRDTDLGAHEVVQSRTGERQLTALVRLRGPLDLPDDQVSTPNLDELVVAYLRRNRAVTA
ncbi:ABC-2 type transport system ATP-binding protein [Saccharothrix variisporea]|uniref:ABC-2 type transport system ATP-binding protein n=1 Tax=Saccharothrix variisporea TaxID=543527 RepID=A0A495X766_9PSEU|nr:ABC-2 type transport system ATP-binding protein [Saccharothrix variisporea]